MVVGVVFVVVVQVEVGVEDDVVCWFQCFNCFKCLGMFFVQEDWNSFWVCFFEFFKGFFYFVCCFFWVFCDDGNVFDVGYWEFCYVKVVVQDVVFKVQSCLFYQGWFEVCFSFVVCSFVEGNFQQDEFGFFGFYEWEFQFESFICVQEFYFFI